MHSINKIRVNAETSGWQNATSINEGLMSAEDKVLLDALVEANTASDSTSITINAPEMDMLKGEFDGFSETIESHAKDISRLESMLGSQGYCGRVWDESNADPKAMTYCGNLDMLRNLPELLGLGCYLVQPDHSRRKLDPTNHYKFADDGTEAKLDGSMGHYQWGWNNVFYISFWHENNMFYEVVSFEPVKGLESYRVPIGSMSACGFAAYDDENEKLCSYINFDPNFRGGTRDDSYDNDSEKTLLGRPITNMSTATFMTAAHKVGEGWFAGSMRMSAVLKVLFDIIMGTRNCQDDYNPKKDVNGLYQGGLSDNVTGLFEGNLDIWSKHNGVNPFLSLETGVNKGDACCVSNEISITYLKLDDTEVTKTFKMPVFFGLKNPYGYLWRASEDEFGLSEAEGPYRMQHYARSFLMTDDYTYANTKGCVMLSVVDSGEWYIQNLSYKNLEIFPYDSCDIGSASTYHCDNFLYFNSSASALRSVYRGGSAYNGSTAGLTFVRVSFDILVATNYIGVSLVEFTEEFPIEPVKA